MVCGCVGLFKPIFCFGNPQWPELFRNLWELFMNLWQLFIDGWELVITCTELFETTPQNYLEPFGIIWRCLWNHLELFRASSTLRLVWTTACLQAVVWMACCTRATAAHVCAQGTAGSHKTKTGQGDKGRM